MAFRLGKPGRGESPKLLIRVPKELRDALKHEAKKAGLTYSEYVRRVLEDHIGRKAKGR